MSQPSNNGVRKLNTEIKVGDAPLIIGDVRIYLEKKSGQTARLRIEAPATTEILTPAKRKSAGTNSEHLPYG